MKVIIIVCTKRNMLMTNGSFWSRKRHILITLDQPEEFFSKFCRVKGANRYMKVLLVVFREKIQLKLIFLAFRPFFTVWLGMVKLSQATAYWILKQSGHDFFHDYYWILKQSGHDFSGKHLYDGYCIGIMWCICVEAKIQQRVVWFCKVSLQICCVIFFECKSPWMLKTDSLIF